MPGRGKNGPTRAWSSPRSRLGRSMRERSANGSTARAATWRTGQRVPARSVRRPHQCCDYLSESAPALVRVNGLRAHSFTPSDRPCSYPVRDRHLRHHSAKAPESRRQVRLSARSIRIALASACPQRRRGRPAARRRADGSALWRRYQIAHRNHLLWALLCRGYKSTDRRRLPPLGDRHAPAHHQRRRQPDATQPRAPIA